MKARLWHEMEAEHILSFKIDMLRLPTAKTRHKAFAPLYPLGASCTSLRLCVLGAVVVPHYLPTGNAAIFVQLCNLQRVLESFQNALSM